LLLQIRVARALFFKLRAERRSERCVCRSPPQARGGSMNKSSYQYCFPTVQSL